MTPPNSPMVDVVLIGSGIMSSNLGALLKSLAPDLSIHLYESAPTLSGEASDGWHNAGTGHAGICELSYTPTLRDDGSVDVGKAIGIFAQFEQSKQFWAHAVAQGMVDSPSDFIRPVPHLSFVHGEKMVGFLRERHRGLAAHPFFETMAFSTDRGEIASWAPLLLDGRDASPVAATKMDMGTDVNFGVVSRKLIAWLEKQPDVKVSANHRVTGLRRSGDGWNVSVRNAAGAAGTVRAKFVFIGAGGGTLPLLQSSGIPEAEGIGGFPIGGQWLICTNPDIVAKHRAKVYGQPLDAAPTMAVPHLDSRILDGKRELLFGPFAAWTTKFLHESGSWLDLPKSVRPNNLFTLLNVGLHNIPLVRYLVQQGTQSMENRMEVLRVFYPGAKACDWKLIDAGIRVQAIKKTGGRAGIVHYGTEVVTSRDGSLSALLGASPGASTSVHIVLQVIERCFGGRLRSPGGRARLDAMVPGHFTDFTRPENAGRFRDVLTETNRQLQL